MSGLEVAGFVLGVLPIAIKALQGYKSFLSSFKTAQRDVNRLERDLETEWIRLQNTCEHLLVGVASTSMIDTMIQNPFGPEWKRYGDKLRLRLWRSSEKFETYVAEMSAATQELKEKLCIQQDGQIKLNDRSSMLRELKQHTVFTLRKKDYEGILSRIKNGNSVLQDLCRQDCGLESDRRQRSQARVTKLLRGLSKSIYNAVSSAMTCACAYTHIIGLELVPRDAVLVPGDTEEQVAKALNFHIVLNSAADDTASWLPTTRHWNSLGLRLADPGNKIGTPTHPISYHSVAAKPKKGIKWTSSFEKSATKGSSSATETLVKSFQTLTYLPTMTSPQLSKISDICQIVLGSQKKEAVGPYGYVLDAQRKFELCPPGDMSDFRDATTLRQVLVGSQPGLPPFDYPERIQLAFALSDSILNLYDTPWLAKSVRLDDIVFLFGDDTAAVSKYSPYRPFVTKGVLPRASQQPTQQAKSPSSLRPMNLTVLSLGALLIQIIIGEAIDELNVADDMDMNSIVSKREAGSRLEDRIMESDGSNYATAVKWCLESVYGVANLQNDSFCQNFYEAVVSRLEEDVNLLGTD
ncbi:Uu.00g129040.m01.CDS01 [Anthostomella pinea]|uniref:Uu.00g129040.m01.CDS01 n=1 Tax=Anthostomella pinea TaxID=933095 RepID=A0AAI8VIF5_9PEZI|nr:Uu.00g129040.m01.CDS01 [Anthostomella pinea]